MKIGLRKFIITILSLISFTLIMCLNDKIDPLSLGLGIGLLLTPHMAANAYEHKFNNKENDHE